MDGTAPNERSTFIQMEKVWKPVFDKYDRNKTGRINIHEFRRILQAGNNHLDEDIPNEVLDEILNPNKKFDNDEITYEEFLDMIHNSDLGIDKPRLQRLVRYAAFAVVPKSQRRSVIRRYLDEYNCMPPPVFIISISLIEIAFFIYYCVMLGEVSATGPVPWKSMLIYHPCRRAEIWRFFTYILIHAGLYHIIANILIQILLGIPLEMVHKWWRVGIVYIAGVLAGSLASSITDPYVLLAGASGGVYALLAAHLASVVINWNEMDFNWYRLAAILLYLGTDIGVAVYGRYIESKKSQVSYSAHFAGAVVGFFVGVNVLRNLKRRRWEVIFGWTVLSLYIIFMASAILFNILNETYFIDPNDPDRCKRDMFNRH